MGERAATHRDDAGFLPIGSYAALGDGNTVALVGADGSVDWLATPNVDAPPLFAAVLDPEDGGRLVLQPAAPFDVQRRYLPDTNVLESEFSTDSGRVRVTEALTYGSMGPLPWTELAQRVEGLEGEVPLRWEVRPGNRFAHARPWAWSQEGTALLLVEDQQVAVVHDGLGEPVVRPHEVRGACTVAAGERGLLAIVVTDDEPTRIPTVADIDRRLEQTAGLWRQWAQGVHHHGPWRDEVVRSALALRLLTQQATGALAAAGTTALPERIGGEKNYDYRFSWVRDSAFALDAMAGLELTAEVHGCLSWLLDAVRGTSPRVHVFYELAGTPADGQIDELPLRGYRDSTPVQAGNNAATQTQLGAYGDLFTAVWRFVEDGAVLDARTGDMLALLADRVCDVWRQDDAGLWELGEYRPYTSSKLGCWVALDRAVRLAERGQLVSLHVDRWRAERAEVRSYIETECWSDERRSLTFHAGTQDLDAATLLAARMGFWSGDDPRLHTMADAVRAELTAEGPLIYRYSGAAQKENAFLACSFWLVEALAYTGRTSEANDLMAGLVARANDVGLYAEQHQPHGQQVGNFPQALTHLALIGAARALAS